MTTSASELAVRAVVPGAPFLYSSADGQIQIQPRLSHRAQRMRLTVSANCVQLVIPCDSCGPLVDTSDIDQFLRQSSSWLRKVTAKMPAPSASDDASAHRPQKLVLPALKQKTLIRYHSLTHATQSPRLAIDTSYRPNGLCGERPSATSAGVDVEAIDIWCEKREPEPIFWLLGKYLQNKAEIGLQPMLAALSAKTGLYYARMRVRGQRTLWGSYSSKGSVNLNYKLLFLSTEVVEYVLLHELCHSRHMNHSPSFWKLVESFMPDFQQRRRLLREAPTKLPPWLDRCR